MHASGHRQAGILIPAFSPRREGDLGIGDTRALREWIDWAADHAVSFIQLLPIHENGAEESPYSAISSVALDPIYLTLDAPEIPGLVAADLDAAREELGPALDARAVDYPDVRRAKRALLELAWSRFGDAGAQVAAEFERFRQQEADWLDDYCLFRYLMECHGEALTWNHWPASCQTPQQARDHVAKLRRRHAAAVDGRFGFFAFVQWLCFRQWRALRAHADSRQVKLMGDVPIGISWHSCDVFFHRDEFLLDCCGGSPPEGMGQSDPFFQQWGQNWGIPLYRWDHMEANGFAWWQKRITRLTEIFQMFRLDHILGFYRIYAFPWRPERNAEFLGLSHEQAAASTAGACRAGSCIPTTPPPTRPPTAPTATGGCAPSSRPLALPKSSPRTSVGSRTTCGPTSPSSASRASASRTGTATSSARRPPASASRSIRSPPTRPTTTTRSTASGAAACAPSNSTRTTRPSSPAGRSMVPTTRCAFYVNLPTSRSPTTARGRRSPRGSACA